MNLVVSQALATGLPVITTRHSGLPDQVIDGVNGLLVDEHDVKALAAAILTLMSGPDLWPSMGVAGRAHVKEHFDSSALTTRQLECYYRLLATEPASAQE